MNQPQKNDDFEFEVEGNEREVTPVQKPENDAPQNQSVLIPQ